MSEKKVGVVAECVCDLPASVVEKFGIDILYFLIETDTGVFTDSKEVSSDNILTYIKEGGKKSRSMPPEPSVYYDVFKKNLEKYDDVILVAISEGVSESCKNAREAAEKFDENAKKRIHIFNSAHLSTGLGHLVMKAAAMAEEGANAEEILAALEEMKGRISTSFITENVNFLYRNGRVSKTVKVICDLFKIRPVLVMKNGQLTLKSVQIGKYESAFRRYLGRELRGAGKIDKERLFLTHAGCNLKTIEKIKGEVAKKCSFDEILVTKASATVSSNCGPNSFGVIYVRKK